MNKKILKTCSFLMYSNKITATYFLVEASGLIRNRKYRIELSFGENSYAVFMTDDYHEIIMQWDYVIRKKNLSEKSFTHWNEDDEKLSSYYDLISFYTQARDVFEVNGIISYYFILEGEYQIKKDIAEGRTPYWIFPKWINSNHLDGIYYGRSFKIEIYKNNTAKVYFKTREQEAMLVDTFNDINGLEACICKAALNQYLNNYNYKYIWGNL